MTALDRRSLLAGLAAASAPRGARAEGAAVTDGAGRPVLVPHRVSRVFPAGPPAAILLYTLAPDLLLGWPRAPRPEERPYLLPEVAARPEVGRLTGRGNTANLEVVLQLRPDLILDVGSTDGAYASLADRVETHMSAPLPIIGSGEAVSAAVAALGSADALLVHVDGKPAGVVTRQDVLGHLAGLAPTVGA